MQCSKHIQHNRVKYKLHYKYTYFNTVGITGKTRCAQGSMCYYLNIGCETNYRQNTVGIFVAPLFHFLKCRSSLYTSDWTPCNSYKTVKVICHGSTNNM